MYLKNPVFGPFLVHFPNFWSKNNFSGKSGCHAQLHMHLYLICLGTYKSVPQIRRPVKLTMNQNDCFRKISSLGGQPNYAQKTAS